MLQYLRWLWHDAPRALRMEFLITLLVIELLALATILVIQGPSSPRASKVSEESVSFGS
jgi:hypothetical protein